MKVQPQKMDCPNCGEWDRPKEEIIFYKGQCRFCVIQIDLNKFLGNGTSAIQT